MEKILQLVDLALPLLMLYWLVTKRSLSIVYVPFIYFASAAVGPSKIGIIYQFIYLGLLAYYIFYNLPFLLKNYSYIFLILMLTYGIFFLGDLKAFRMKIIGLYWVLTVITLAPEIANRYTKFQIFNELFKACSLILLFFISNSFLATALRYFPENHYGFTSGISFGNLDISEYSILPLATYVVFRKAIKDNKIILILVVIVGLMLTLLTMRRMVMLVSLMGVLLVLVELLNPKQIKNLLFYCLIISILAGGLIISTDFKDQLIERFERRNLAERDLANEGRVLEFGLLYKDLFQYFDYDPWFGYGPLQSWGNYGKGIFGDRPLHSDITYFIHGFGFIGFFAYLFMVGSVFFKAFYLSRNRWEKFMFVFCLSYFIIFLFVGSPKTPMSPVMLFMIISVCFGKSSLQNSRNFININSHKYEFA